MQPASRRCSSLICAQQTRSSRLAIRAPRPSRCDAGLSPRAARRALFGSMSHAVLSFLGLWPWSIVSPRLPTRAQASGYGRLSRLLALSQRPTPMPRLDITSGGVRRALPLDKPRTDGRWRSQELLAALVPCNIDRLVQRGWHDGRVRGAARRERTEGGRKNGGSLLGFPRRVLHDALGPLAPLSGNVSGQVTFSGPSSERGLLDVG